MSDSRAITLKISVRDADVVRQQLVAMGDQGAAALSRLDNAARAAGGSGGGGGGSGGGSGGGGFGGLRNAVGQAGYQIQDFTVQVQGGTSALVALSQQGSQFLGIFGPGGAIAGAILTVGILVARMLDLGKANEDAAFAAGAFSRAMEASNAVLLTANERSMQAAENKRREAREALSLAAAIERENLARANAAAGRIAEDDAAPGASTVPSMFSRAGQRRAAGQRLATAAEQSAARLVDLQSRIDAMDRQGVDRGLGQYGPDAPGGASRGGRSAAARTLDLEDALARSRNQALEEGARLIQRNETAYESYQRRLESLGQLVERSDSLGISLSPETIQREAEAAEKALRRLEAGTQRNVVATRDSIDVTRQLGLTFTSSFEDAISSGKSFGGVLQSLSEDLGKLIIRFTVVEPLARSFANVFSGNGKAGGSGTGGGFDWMGALGSVVTSAAGSFFGGGSSFKADKIAGARADGGPVAAGQTYLVGERGPELFTAGANGFVTSNGAMAGGAINYAPSFTINAPGAVPAMLPQIEAIARRVSAASLAQFADSINRGGAAAKLVGRR